MSNKWSRFKKEVSYFERRLPGFHGIKLNTTDSKELYELRDRLLRIVEEFGTYLAANESTKKPQRREYEHSRGGCSMERQYF